MIDTDREDCIYCNIIRGRQDDQGVFFRDEHTIGLMDIRPLKPGHALLVPIAHHETVKDLPPDLLRPFFYNAQLLAQAVEVAFDADGSFSGYNTHVSQSVPHFHLHVVPRKFGDKLFAGGKWIRHPYKDEQTAIELCEKLRIAMAKLVET